MNTTAGFAIPTTTDQAATTAKAKTALWKKIYFVLTMIMLVVWGADRLWKMSGSSEWKLAKEVDGVRVYTLKAPGDKLIKLKTIMVGDYSLNQLVAVHLVDDNLETCKEWIPGCMQMTRIKDWDDTHYDLDMWLVDFPAPLSDRELLISTMIRQDPASKAVTVDAVALPNALPHTKGVLRVERMHNLWSFRPQANGQTEVELIQDTDMGGFFPYFMFNLITVDESVKFFSVDLRNFLKKEKYINAKFDWIQEP